MNCFRLENVSHRYDKATVLHGVDLRLEPGEILDTRVAYTIVDGRVVFEGASSNR